MSYRKKQFDPDSEPQNLSFYQPPHSQEQESGRFIYEGTRNKGRQVDGYNPGKMNKKPGSFAKRYNRMQQAAKRKKEEKKSKTKGKEFKIRLLKEFESVNAPLVVFCKWYGIEPRTFRLWRRRFRKEGENGLEDKRQYKKGVERVAVPMDIQEEIIRLKLENPGIGAHKISDWMARHRFIKLSERKVQQVLISNPQTAVLIAPGKRIMRGNSGKEPQHFERSNPGDMYQMDIMTFMLHGLYRVYVIGCLDDHSRFVVGLGLFRRQTTDRCLDVLRSAIEKYGMPKEVLTDNGRQFYTWRGKSAFQKYLIQSGISHVRSRPYHPETLGKIESLWRNIYQELLSKNPLKSFEDAQEKLEKWVEWYNYNRPHQGIGGLVPADRFFGVDRSIRDVMEKGAVMVKEAMDTDPRQARDPVYLIGKIDGKEIRIIAKEGSVTVDEPKPTQENKSKEEQDVSDDTAGGRKEAAGAGEEGTGQVPQEHTGQGEIQVSDGGADGQKEREAGSEGSGSGQGNDLGVDQKAGGGGGGKSRKKNRRVFRRGRSGRGGQAETTAGKIRK